MTVLLNRILSLGAALPMILTAGLATAAGTATIQTEGDSSTLAWLDTDTVRLDTPKAEGGYLLLRDGKVYLVNTEAGNGMPPVLEVGDMMQGFAQAFGGQGGPLKGSALPFDERIESVKKTGKTQTVAGIRGEQHEVTYTDDKGKQHTVEAILTDNRLVTEMTDAFLALSEGLVGKESVAQSREALPADTRGLLQVGHDMTLQSISDKAPDAGQFALPAPPTNLGDMMQQMMKQMSP